MTEPHPAQRGMVVIDGAGERYEVLGYQATFTLQSLSDPTLVVQCGSADLAQLGLEWNGRTLREVGS